MDEPQLTATDERAVLARLVQAFEASEQSTSESRTERELERDYVNGYQWTAEEIATLKKRKQPVVTNNRIGPKVRTLKGMEAQQRAQPKAFPRTPKEEDGANAATDSLRYVMDDQRWDRTRSECFDHYSVEGACGVDVRVVEKYGEMCIEILPIAWDRMWGDPHSRSTSWNDGKAKGQVIWMDLEDAEEKWPDKTDVLSATMASVSTNTGQTYDDVPRTRWADPHRKRVLIVEAWTKEQGSVWHSVYTKGGILERMESPYLNEDGEPEDGFVFGSCFIDRDGDRFGVVKDWVSIQDEINKRRSKFMHLANVRQTWGNKLAGDVNKLKRELAKPDGHVEIEADGKMGEDFGVLPTGDIADAQFNLLQEAKSEIDAVGVNAALSGTDKRQLSGRAQIQRSEQGMVELTPVFDGFKQFQLDVYRKVWNRIRQFWTAEKWIRVTDDEKNVRFVGLNQPMTLGEQLLDELKKQGKQITPEMEEQAKMDPAMQVIVGIKNNIAELDVDIEIDDAPAAATIQAEQFEALTNIAPALTNMPPPLAKVLIKASQLRNKEELLKILEGDDEQQSPELVQMQQQMQEMQAALQQAQAAAADKTGDIELKRAELALKDRELAIKEAEMRLKISEAQSKADPTGLALKTELERQALSMQHERALFEKDKRIALLEIKAGVVAAQHAEERVDAAAQEFRTAEADLAATVQQAATEPAEAGQ